MSKNKTIPDDPFAELASDDYCPKRTVTIIYDDITGIKSSIIKAETIKIDKKNRLLYIFTDSSEILVVNIDSIMAFRIGEDVEHIPISS